MTPNPKQLNCFQDGTEYDALGCHPSNGSRNRIFKSRCRNAPHGTYHLENAPDGRVQKSDTIVAKNYLSDKEVSALNRLSTAFLDFAELRAERQIITTMADWKNN